MRPVFCGSFDYDTRQSELDRLFSKFGKVERVDMKSGTLPMEIELLHWLISLYINLSMDKEAFLLTCSSGERGSRHREGSKSMANQRPTKTLFVINFDPINTRTRDIEKHFEPFGKILHVRIRRNFAFVQFDKQEEATKALESTHMSKVLGRVVSVEYALRDDGERGDRHESPRRGYGGRGDSPYGRSRSPVHHRSRPSPDYGRARSPDYGRARSPDYGRGRSPVYDKYNGPSYNGGKSSEYVRYRSRSPGRR
ncbi:hypothetical protein IFM89_029693 [Coptis chinensis]|uniref:RRM domain-containing protein n=1 Tax=Coptis chinensis TaxID=261450 RepID=A0A835IFY9_9MAGN|nr:hypothetical protein IFM89_029693 [Coptis chinensis]